MMRANNILTGWHVTRLEIKFTGKEHVETLTCDFTLWKQKWYFREYWESLHCICKLEECCKVINKAYLIRVFPHFFNEESYLSGN